MRTILRLALASSILLIAAIAAMPRHTNAMPSSDLLGAWRLTAVDGKNPTTINVKSWKIEFKEEGKWVYAGAMSGEYEGTQVSGSGTWLLQGNLLDYTAGDTKGQTTVHVDRNSLTFSPDPVLRSGGKVPLETRYVRPVSP